MDLQKGSSFDTILACSENDLFPNVSNSFKTLIALGREHG